MSGVAGLPLDQEQYLLHHRKEFALLETFMRRPSEVLSGLDRLENAWYCGYENRSNVVDTYVRYLREKVERTFGLTSIETVRGSGYRLRRDYGA